MNWTGGNLRRHSRRKWNVNRNSRKRKLAQIQSASQRKLFRPSPSPISILAEPLSDSFGRSRHSGCALPIVTYTRETSPTRNTAYSGETCCIDGVPTTSDSSRTFATLKAKLLSRDDWLSTKITKPLDTSFPSIEEKERIGRPRKLDNVIASEGSARDENQLDLAGIALGEQLLPTFRVVKDQPRQWLSKGAAVNQLSSSPQPRFTYNPELNITQTTSGTDSFEIYTQDPHSCPASYGKFNSDDYIHLAGTVADDGLVGHNTTHGQALDATTCLSEPILDSAGLSRSPITNFEMSPTRDWFGFDNTSPHKDIRDGFVCNEPFNFGHQSSGQIPSELESDNDDAETFIVDHNKHQCWSLSDMTCATLSGRRPAHPSKGSYHRICEAEHESQQLGYDNSFSDDTNYSVAKCAPKQCSWSPTYKSGVQTSFDLDPFSHADHDEKFALESIVADNFKQIPTQFRRSRRPYETRRWNFWSKRAGSREHNELQSQCSAISVNSDEVQSRSCTLLSTPSVTLYNSRHLLHNGVNEGICSDIAYEDPYFTDQMIRTPATGSIKHKSTLIEKTAVDQILPVLYRSPSLDHRSILLQSPRFVFPHHRDDYISEYEKTL